MIPQVKNILDSIEQYKFLSFIYNSEPFLDTVIVYRQMLCG